MEELLIKLAYSVITNNYLNTLANIFGIADIFGHFVLQIKERENELNIYNIL